MDLFRLQFFMLSNEPDNSDTAYKNKQIDKKWLLNFYALKTSNEPIENLLIDGEVNRVSMDIKNGIVSTSAGKLPNWGDILFLDGASHVVYATGRFNGGIEVVSFSPLPIWGDGQNIYGSKNVRPEITTVEHIIQNLHDLYPDVPSDWNRIKLTFGSPSFKKTDGFFRSLRFY